MKLRCSFVVVLALAGCVRPREPVAAAVCPDRTVPLGPVRALANVVSLQGCRVKVQGYLRISGQAALFVTAEEAMRFNLNNSFMLRVNKEPSEGGYTLFISGEKVSVPIGVVDAILEGEVGLTELGEPFIRDLSILNYSLVDRQ
jgi:hypothetical protein